VAAALEGGAIYESQTVLGNKVFAVESRDAEGTTDLEGQPEAEGRTGTAGQQWGRQWTRYGWAC
ncbi:MAG: hypothetical protein OXG36_16005, partial [Caldilineaceae bacterium]|nr:hypothetical protein [Caldilineaceae bacterium]